MTEKGKDVPLSVEEIKRIRVKKSPLLVADELRQQAGINTVDGEGFSLGRQINKDGITPEITRILAKKDSRRQLSLEEKRLLEGHYWLNPEDSEDFPVLKVDDPEQLVTVEGLVILTRKVQELVQCWLDQSGNEKKRRQTLVELSIQNFPNKTSLVFEVVLAREKINILTQLGGIDERLKESLEVLMSFYDKDLLPLLFPHDKGEKKQQVKNEVIKMLETPKGHGGKKETYTQKAERLLIGKKGKRATKKFHDQTKFRVMRELPQRLDEEFLALATTVNFVKLLERLEEKGIDILQIRTKVQELLKNIPERSGGGKLTREEKRWFREFNAWMSIPTNAIAEEFPHDTAYLLSQILEHNQAVCAGKTMMLQMIYGSFGLDAKSASVLIQVGEKSKGEHNVCHVNLSNGMILTIDANWRRKSSLKFLLTNTEVGLNKYEINVGILVPTGETYETEQVKAFLDDMERRQIVVFKNGQCSPKEYVIVGLAHRLVAQPQEQEPFNKYNLANFLEKHVGLFVKTKYGETESDVIKAAAQLFEEAIGINPNKINGKYNLAFLIIRNLNVFAQETPGRITYLKKVKKLFLDCNMNGLSTERAKVVEKWIRLVDEKIIMLESE